MELAYVINQLMILVHSKVWICIITQLGSRRLPIIIPQKGNTSKKISLQLPQIDISLKKGKSFRRQNRQWGSIALNITKGRLEQDQDKIQKLLYMKNTLQCHHIMIRRDTTISDLLSAPKEWKACSKTRIRT